MEMAEFWNVAAGWVASLPQTGLLIAALVAMAVSGLGSILARVNRPAGKLLRGTATLALGGILLLVVLQMARFDSRFDVAVPQLGMPEQVVQGGETRVKLAGDGHFWIRAAVNGKPADFMVDTGATLTAVSEKTAQAAGLLPRRGGLPVTLTTANGSVEAHLTNIEMLRFGNVEASGIDAVIAPNLGKMNVLGMNLLSRLASWRVEGDTLIMVPKAVEPAERTAEIPRPG